MSRKTSFLTLMTLVMSALFLLPMAAMAAPAQSTQAKTTTSNFAFAGLVNKGRGVGTNLLGGLTLQSESNGKFTGTLSDPVGFKTPVAGNVTKGKITINIGPSRANNDVIKGQGTLKNGNQFVGSFQIVEDKKEVASGIWSALAVANPSQEKIFAYTDGNVGGVLLLDSKKLTGNLNASTGKVIPAKATIARDKSITLVLSLSSKKQLVGVGHPLTNGQQGYEGSFNGAAHDNPGSWKAQAFSF